MTNGDIVLGIDLGTNDSVACAYIDGEPFFIKNKDNNGILFPSYVAFCENECPIVGDSAKNLLTDSENIVSLNKKKLGSDIQKNFFGESYSLQDIVAFLLSKIKKDAELQLGKPINKAVISVPSYFNIIQRTAIKNSAKIAGLDVESLIIDSTACGLTYIMNNPSKIFKNIMIFDLGSGTLNITIMKCKEFFCNVLSTWGKLDGGGNDFNFAIMDYLRDEFKKQYGFDLPSDKLTENRLFLAAEKAKIDLSTSTRTEINLENIFKDSDGKFVTFNTTIPRIRLRSVIHNIIKKLDSSINFALDDANLNKNQIDKLILVGGSTKLPIVKEYVEKFMEKNAVVIDSVGFVAQGAAIKSEINNGKLNAMSFHDVVPLSLGLKISGKIYNFINRNSSFPTLKKIKFRPVKDYQHFITVKVVQGDNKSEGTNVYLGDFDLKINPAPKKKTNINIVFFIDINGILTVTAKEESRRNSESFNYESRNQISESEFILSSNRVDNFVKKYTEELKNVEKTNKMDHIIDKSTNTDNSVLSIDEIISKINCKSFSSKYIEKSILLNDFDEIIKPPLFELFFRDLDDDESSKLIIKIKKDISDENISGDISDVLDFYISEFKLIKKQISLNQFLDEYINSDDFNKLVRNYNFYTHELIVELIEKVRNDISNDESMDNEKVIRKLEYYFKVELNKIDYFNKIDDIKAKTDLYLQKYNLTYNEFNEILNYIQIKIDKGYHIKNINACMIDKIKRKIDSNRTDSRLKLKSLLNNRHFIENNNLTQDKVDIINERVGELIYRNKIRSNDISEDFLLKQLRWDRYDI